MSKSKGNVINPDFYVKEFGADTLRMYLMFLGPFQDGGDFQDRGIVGIQRFLNRVWKLTPSVTPNASEGSWKVKRDSSSDRGRIQNDVGRLFHQTIKKVTEDIEALHFNTAISSLMSLLNRFEAERSVPQALAMDFLKLLAPFAPHLAEELWHKLGESGSVHQAAWPTWDDALTQEETFELVIQVNGKVRDKAVVPRTIVRVEAEKVAFSSEKIKKILGTRKLKKVIFVTGRLINLVV